MNTIARSPTVSRPLYPWWLVLLQGIGAVLLGLVLVSALGAAVDVLAQALGWFWMIVATAAAVSLFVDGRLWAAKLASAILGVVAAALVVEHPLWAAALTPVTLTWILGIYGIIAGATALARAVMDGAGWALGALGLTVFLLGVGLLSTPVIATTVLIGVMAAVAIVGGIAAIVGSLGRRSAERVEREEAVAGVAAPAEVAPTKAAPEAAPPPQEAPRQATRVYPAPEVEPTPEPEPALEEEPAPEEHPVSDTTLETGVEREPEVERDGGSDVERRY